jgi:hypothetical protein
MPDAAFILSRDLCAHLNEVEERKLKIRQGRAENIKEAKKAPIPPAESLPTERERMLEDNENRVLAQTEQVDSSFRAAPYQKPTAAALLTVNAQELASPDYTKKWTDDA